MIYAEKPLAYRGVDTLDRPAMWVWADGRLTPIDLDLFDELVVMRYAELEAGKFKKRLSDVCKQASSKHSRNPGCDWLNKKLRKPDSRRLLARRRSAKKKKPSQFKQPWSAEEVQFVADNLGTLTRAEIARRLGRTAAGIQHVMSRLNKERAAG